MGYDIAGEIVDNAVREVPEAILEAPEVRGAIEYLTSALADYSDYIDPDGDELEERISEAMVYGAEEVSAHYESLLLDALYRQRMFGEDFVLEDFIAKVRSADVHELVHG